MVWAMDVCRALEIGNTGQALLRLDEEDKRISIISNDGIRGNPNMTIISEAGLYSLVLSSRKPEARSFMWWVVHEVIPSIRKRGVYMTPDTVVKALFKPRLHYSPCHRTQSRKLGVLIADDREYFPATECVRIFGYKEPEKAIRGPLQRGVRNGHPCIGREAKEAVHP